MNRGIGRAAGRGASVPRLRTLPCAEGMGEGRVGARPRGPRRRICSSAASVPRRQDRVGPPRDAPSRRTCSHREMWVCRRRPAFAAHLFRGALARVAGCHAGGAPVPPSASPPAHLFLGASVPALRRGVVPACGLKEFGRARDAPVIGWLPEARMLSEASKEGKLRGISICYQLLKGVHGMGTPPPASECSAGASAAVIH